MLQNHEYLIFYDNIINFEENVRLIVYYQQTFFQTKSKTYNLKIKEHRKIKFAWRKDNYMVDNQLQIFFIQPRTINIHHCTH